MPRYFSSDTCAIISSLFLMFNDSVTGNVLIEKHIDFVFLECRVKKEASSQADTFSKFLDNFSSISTQFLPDT